MPMRINGVYFYGSGYNRSYAATTTAASTTLITTAFEQYNAQGQANPSVTLNVTAGDTLIAFGSIRGTTPPASGAISDNLGNTWTYIPGSGVAASSNAAAAAWYCASAKVGSTTITFNSGGVSAALVVHEYGGIDPAHPVDAVSVSSGTSSTPSSGNLTTNYVNDTLVGFTSQGTSTPTYSTGTGYAPRASNTSVIETYASEDQIVGSTGTYSAGFNQGVSAPWVCIGLALKPAALFVASDVGAAVFVSDLNYANLLLPGTYITAIGSGGSSCTLSQPAICSSGPGTLARVIASMQDAVVLGGTSEQQNGTGDDIFAGYNTVVQNCIFQFVRRAVFLRSACNGIVVVGNEIRSECGAGFDNEAAIDVDGLEAGAGSCHIAGNTIELSWYKNGIRCNYVTSNAHSGNYIADPPAFLGSNAYRFTRLSAYNLVLGGNYSGVLDESNLNSSFAGTSTTVSRLSTPLTCGPTGNIFYVPLKVQGAVGQGIDLQRWLDGASNVLASIDLAGNATFPSLTVNGGNVKFLALQVPSGVTVAAQGATGSTTYGYRISAVNALGQTLACPTVFISNGAALSSLGVSNYNLITIPKVNGATAYNIYGRAAGSEQLMTTLAAAGENVTSYTWSDTGVATPSGNLPTSTLGTKEVVQAWQAQTANIQEWQTAPGAVLASMDSGGNVDRYGTNESILPLQVPSGVTVVPQGTTQSTTYGYRVSATNAQGETLACSTVPISNGNSALTPSNYNLITIPNVNGATAYKIYGRTSGSELFMISVTATGGSVTWKDIGTVTPSSPLPLNPTGTKEIIQAWQGQTGNLQEWQSSAGGILAKVDASGNATFANFATAHVASDVAFSSTTLGNITGLSFAIPASQTWSFEAYLEVVSATTNGGVIAVTLPSGASVLLMIDPQRFFSNR